MGHPTDEAVQQEEALRLQDPDPDRVIEAAFQRAARLSYIDLGLVFLPTEGGLLWPRWRWGVEEGSLRGLAPLPPDGSSVTGRSVLTGRTQMVSEGPEEPGWHPEWWEAFPLVEGIAVPLFLGDGGRGAFLVGWFKPFQLDEKAVAVVEGVAYHVAAALQRAEWVSRSERDRRHLEGLMEVLPVPLVVLEDAAHRITRVNAEARLLLGEVAGREVSQVVAERRFRSLGGRGLEPDQVACALAVWRWKEGFRIRMTAADGSERIVAVSVVPEATEGSTLVAFRDTTSEFGFEEKRARFMEAAVERLGGPLRELKGYSDLLLSRFADGGESLAAEMTEALHDVVERLDRQAAILEAVVTLRPVHPSELRMEAPADLVRAAWEAIGCRRADVRVVEEEQARVLCAPRLVVRALEEVLGSFRDGGVQWVEVEMTAKQGSVEMLGRGLPYRAQDAVRARGGDLNLGVARASLEATGGTLEVDQGGGSFSLRLPQPT